MSRSTHAANEFLMKEYYAGHLSSSSLDKLKNRWQKKHNLVLRGLVETEFRDSRHVLLLPSVLQLVERARRETLLPLL
jgi:hypothetical protein